MGLLTYSPGKLQFVERITKTKMVTQRLLHALLPVSLILPFRVGLVENWYFLQEIPRTQHMDSFQIETSPNLRIFHKMKLSNIFHIDCTELMQDSH